MYIYCPLCMETHLLLSIPNIRGIAIPLLAQANLCCTSMYMCECTIPLALYPGSEEEGYKADMMVCMYITFEPGCEASHLTCINIHMY